MGTPAVLSRATAGWRTGNGTARGRALAWLAAVLLPSLLPATAPLAADEHLSAQPSGIPDVETYRALNLALMVAEGASREWAVELDPAGAQSAPDRGLTPPIDVEALQTPLNRIADPRRMVARAARLFRYARANEDGIRAAISRFAQESPDAVTTIDPAHLAEEALIIRSSLAATLEDQWRGRDGVSASPTWRQGLAVYQDKTIYLRNMMEFWDFDRELAAITEQALRETGTRIEAYQRLLEVDPRLDAFTQHLRAVEYVYREYGTPEKTPDDPSEELIEAASQVD